MPYAFPIPLPRMFSLSCLPRLSSCLFFFLIPSSFTSTYAFHFLSMVRLSLIFPVALSSMPSDLLAFHRWPRLRFSTRFHQTFRLRHLSFTIFQIAHIFVFPRLILLDFRDDVFAAFVLYRSSPFIFLPLLPRSSFHATCHFFFLFISSSFFIYAFIVPSFD